MSDFSKFPEELRKLPRWVGYRNEERDGRFTKVLFDVKSLELASSTDPSTWSTFEQVLKGGKYFHGPGCVIAPPYCALDLDVCRDPKTGETEHWAWQIIAHVNSYTELSPSGRGFHIWCKATMPVRGRKIKMTNLSVQHPPDKHPALEAYVSGRYFTVTGQVISALQEPWITDTPSGALSAQIETRDLTEFFTIYFGELTDAEIRSSYIPPVSPGDSDESASGAEFSLACAVVRDMGADATVEQNIAEFLKRAKPRAKLRRRDYVLRTMQNARSTVSIHRTRWKDPFEGEI